MLFSLLICIVCSIYFSAARPLLSSIPPDNVDLVVSRLGSNIRLFGTFSQVGYNYETAGKVVQVSTFRACDARRKGLDRTLFGHVAVVFVDEVQPFLTGCVAIDNQARFAEKSGALALIVGPSSRIQRSKAIKIRSSKIPVVILDDNETARLRTALGEAAATGAETTMQLIFVEPRSTQVLKLQVFRPTLLNLALVGLLILLVAFITVLVFVKIRWRPTAHRDLWLRTLARSAMSKMEIRKVQKNDGRKRRPFARLKKVRSSYLPVFGSLTSVANTVAGQDRCAICLEEYREGVELRVLFCGHEFHPKCVDPWLLSNRRCPLCQFDVVYKQYPANESSPKSRTSAADASSAVPECQAPLLGQETPRREVQRSRRVASRPRSVPRRRPLRPREQVSLAVRIGGYSSDVSSALDHREHVPRVHL